MADRDEGGKFLKGNATGFKPGASGNPAGRPKFTLISDALRFQLAKECEGSSVAERIAATLITAALDNDISACREILDRVEGKPRQNVDVDMQLTDWREAARREGITEEDVIREVNALIIAAVDPTSLDAGDSEAPGS